MGGMELSFSGWDLSSDKEVPQARRASESNHWLLREPKIIYADMYTYLQCICHSVINYVLQTTNAMSAEHARVHKECSQQCVQLMNACHAWPRPNEGALSNVRRILNRLFIIIQSSLRVWPISDAQSFQWPIKDRCKAAIFEWMKINADKCRGHLNVTTLLLRRDRHINAGFFWI